MKNHGNAPTSAQYAELAGIVQSKLWSAIKDRLSKEEMQALVTGNGPEEVLKRLRKAFAMVEKTENESSTLSASPFFADEEKPSNDGYPPEYAVKPIAEQLLIWSKQFPNFDPCNMLAYSKRLPKCPEGAEGPFVVPVWKEVGASYEEAVKKILSHFNVYYRFGHQTFEEAIGMICQSDRTREAERVLAPRDDISDMRLQGYPFMLLWAQMGFLHRGRSNRRVRYLYAPNEFGLGAFAVASILCTHPERFSLSHGSVCLNIFCPGDETTNAEGEFCYAPCFSRGFYGDPLGFGTEFNGVSDEHCGPATAFLPADVSA